MATRYPQSWPATKVDKLATKWFDQEMQWLREELREAFLAIEDQFGSVDLKGSVKAATTGALPAYTAADGPDSTRPGVGKTLTGNANGALAAQDGQTLVAGDRLLVKNESGASEKNNGIYSVTQVGTGSTPFILTRTPDADESQELNPNMLVPVDAGTLNAGKIFRLTNTSQPTLETTALTFASLTPGGTDPLTLSDNTALTVGDYQIIYDETTDDRLEITVAAASQRAAGSGLVGQKVLHEGGVGAAADGAGQVGTAGGSVTDMGGAGGAASGADNGAAGGAVVNRGGTGGAAHAGGGAAGTGGAAGSIAGAGGAGAATVAGGVGGVGHVYGGAGAAATGGGAAGAVGGVGEVKGGAGGAANTADNAGVGGAAKVTGGAGGAASGGGGTGGVGGAAQVTGGAGGAGNTGDAGGVGGVGEVRGGAGAAATAGAAGQDGGAANVISGTGGAANGANAAGSGGISTIQGGAGGVGSAGAPGGSGGNVDIFAGPGGADGGAGAGVDGSINIGLVQTRGIKMGAAAGSFRVGSDGGVIRQTTVTEDTTIGDATISAAEILGGIYHRGTGVDLGAPRTDTLDTAANIVAAIPNAEVGDTVFFHVTNNSSTAQNLIITAGAGGTDKSAAAARTLAQNTSALFAVRLTNVTAAAEAYDLFRVG